MSAHTDILENKFIDWFFRAQAIGITGASAAAGTGPATLWIGLITAAGSDASPGTEVTGGSYARVAVTSSLANWAGTQAAGSTTASSGTSGTTSNNNTVTFPAPTANWGTVVEFGIFDAATAGNEVIRAPLTASQTINSGQIAPTFAPGTLQYVNDN